MKIEKRNNHKKKIIIGGVIITTALVVGIFATSYSKYRITESIKLGEGIINYSSADFELVGMYLINEDNTETKIDVVPGDGYVLNEEKTKCTVNNTEIVASIEYKDNKLYFGDITSKGTKCKVYFNKILDSEVPVISNVAVEKGDTSIKVTVTATDNTGIDKYYYQIETNTVEESTSNEHTFSGLTKGQKYTVKIYVTDAAGNKSSVWSGELSTKTTGDTIIAGGNPKPGTNSFTGPATTAADSGFFSTTDDDGTTNYYRGVINNNWVDFAGLKWRIIRINGDGSIRMIYNGTSTATTGTGTQISTSAFNSTVNDNTYVGYMYGSAGQSSYAATHKNTNNSTIKGVLDNWYKTNIVDRNYDKYVSKEAGFCGDRQVASGHSSHTGNGVSAGATIYAPANRLLTTNLSDWKTTQTPTYSCNTNDLYTVAASSKGNKKLTYPVGLISADEVVYAGGFGGDQNKQYWLYTNQEYWTMSPGEFVSREAFVCFMFNDGSIGWFNIMADYNVSITWGVRPVINLSASVQLSGNGTTSDPFRIVS